ncbi:MAG: hypothetical protein ACREV5_04375, partial [Steroidobacter sp.]
MNALRMMLLATGLWISTIEICTANGSAAQIVIDWNERAYESAFAEDQFQTFKGQRAHAMMHLAQHDALNGVDRRFDRYLTAKRRSSLLEPYADASAAAAQAAHDVLLSQYPNDRQAIRALLAQQLASIPEGPDKQAGQDLGRRSAASILAVRTGDGIDRKGAYAFSGDVGAYQTSPGWKGFVAWPAFG